MRLQVPHLTMPPSVRGARYIKALLPGLVVALVAVGLFLVLHNPTNKTLSSVPARTTPSQEEKLSAGPISALLKKGNIGDYQASQRAQAQNYYYSKDYADAERIMLTTFSNIPANKIDSASYEMMVAIEKGKGDNSQTKHYLGLLIPMLKSAGDTQAVDYYQGELSKL